MLFWFPCITVMVHEHLDVSNYRQFDCFFSLKRLRVYHNVHQRSTLLAAWSPWCGALVLCSAKRQMMRKIFSFHEVFMAGAIPSLPFYTWVLLPKGDIGHLILSVVCDYFSMPSVPWPTFHVVLTTLHRSTSGKHEFIRMSKHNQ